MNSGRYHSEKPVASFFGDRASGAPNEEFFPRSSEELREEKRKEKRRVKMIQQRFTTQTRSFSSGLKLPSIGSMESSGAVRKESATTVDHGRSDRKIRHKSKNRRHRNREISPFGTPAGVEMARPSSRPGSRMNLDIRESNTPDSSYAEIDVEDDYGYDISKRRQKKRKKRKHKKKHRRRDRADHDNSSSNIVFEDDADVDLSKTHGRGEGHEDEFRTREQRASIKDTFKEIFGKISDVADATLDELAHKPFGQPQFGTASKSNDRTSDPTPWASSTEVQVDKADDMMLVEDMDDFEDDELQDIPVPVKKKGLKIDAHLANELRTIFFGSARRTFSPAWKSQGFVFNTRAQREGQLFGMIQHKGGPCGPCAVMQAFVVKHLLFDKPCKDWMNPTNDEVLGAVTAGMVDALVRAGGGMGCSVALIGGRSGIGGTKDYRPDGITECLEVFKMASRQEAMQFLSQQHVLEQFTAPNGCGIILFCYSLVLSRGVGRVRKDADPGFGFMQPFIGEFDYASQELVNLGMTGCAFSNVFDGIKELKGDKKEDCIRLMGIENISKIGFLTLFEHYGHVEVGTNYKSPRYPIWVVCSESHYSLFFQTPKMAKATSATAAAKSPFELCYYDTLARHEEIIRLTIDPQGKHKADEADPPLEKVLRTKWKKCGIKWIGDAVL